jgi:hypothetical protein
VQDNITDGSASFLPNINSYGGTLAIFWGALTPPSVAFSNADFIGILRDCELASMSIGRPLKSVSTFIV